MPDRRLPLDNGDARYSLYVPDSYRPERAYPLIICLHGAGFTGEAYLDRWRPRLGDDYLLACPTIEGGAWWTGRAEAMVLAVLTAVQREYHIDLDRVVLTGMSNGGVGTFLIGLNHADRFAALVPMAAAFPPGLAPLLDNADNTPFYLIHGSKDQVMPVQYSRDVAAYLRKRGSAVVYREHDREHPMAGGHFFPKDELPDLVAWLGQQRRVPQPRAVVMVRDRYHAGRSYWVRIDAIDPSVASFAASEFDSAESKKLQAGDYARLQARVEGNTITLTTERVRRFTLLLNRDVVDLERPIRVVGNGRVVFDGLVHPDARVLLTEVRRRPDPQQLVLAEIPINLDP